MDKTVLKSLVDTTNSILADVESGRYAKDAPEVQVRIQALLDGIACNSDVDALRDHTSAEFAELFEIACNQVWPGVRENDYIFNAEEYENHIAQALGWPPVMEPVAVVLGLIAVLLRRGIPLGITTEFDSQFDFVPFEADQLAQGEPLSKRKNGWAAFCLVYGNLIRAI